MKLAQKTALILLAVTIGLMLSYISFNQQVSTDHFKGGYICPNPTSMNLNPNYDEVSYTAGFPVSANFSFMFDTANDCQLDLSDETSPKEIISTVAFYINAVIYSLGVMLIIYLLRRYAHTRN